MKKIAAWILGAVLFPIAAMGEETQPVPPAKAASKKAAQPKAKPAQSAGPGQVTVFIPKYTYSYNLFTRDRVRTETRGGEFDVEIDRQEVGHVAPGKPLTVAVPAGPHRLHLGGGGILGIRLTYDETAITVSPGKTSYFYAMRNSISALGTTPAELDPVTAKALINGEEPKASGTATIYIYWQGTFLDIDFLKSDFDFFIDGQRIGTMTSGQYIVAKVPAGMHVLTRRSTGFLLGASFQQDLILGAGITHYYLLTRNTKYEEFFQLTAEQVSPELKSLRQR
jgi:hypothetical protein